MSRTFEPGHLDIARFTAAAAQVEGRWDLAELDRLAGESCMPPQGQGVPWSADGSRRTGPEGDEQIWLRIQARASVEQVCQRCLEPVTVDLSVDRRFRFVADEATAMALDGDSDEDLLVLSRSLDLRALIEDELLLELPPIPRHERCPVPVRLRVADPGFVDPGEDSERRPFEALAALKAGKVAKAP